MLTEKKLGTGTLLIVVTVAIITVFLDVHPFMNEDVLFIGHADQAHMANLARNIAEGNGFVVDNIWLLRNGGLAGSELPRPEDYWSIYVAAFIALYFKLFGATLESMLLAASTIKLAIATLAVWWTWLLTKSRLAFVACGIFMLAHPKMSAVVTGQSDIYLTLTVLLFGTTMYLAITRKIIYLLFFSGLLTGVAIGVKPSGALLVGCLLAYIFLTARKSGLIARSFYLVMGLVVGLSPLIMHNISAFKKPVPPALELVREGAAQNWVRGQGPDAFYNPEPIELSADELLKVKKEMPFAQMKDFVEKCARGNLVPLWFFPFLYYWIVSVITRVREGKQYLNSPETLFAVFVGLMSVGGLILSSQINMSPRYWNFLVPLYTIPTIAAMAQMSRHFLIFVIAWTIAVGSVHYLEKETKLVPESYAQLKTVIPADAIVLTSNPWEFAFHTRHRAVALPFNDNTQVLKQVAERYNAEYLVIIGNDARHTAYDEIEQGNFPPYIENLYSSRKLKVGRFNWDKLDIDTQENRSLSKSVPRGISPPITAKAEHEIIG